MEKVEKVQKHIGVAEFRRDLSGYLRRAKKVPVIIDTPHDDTRVLVDAAFYDRLVEAYEDEQDAKLLTRLVKEQKGEKGVPLEKLLRQHGISR